MRRNSVVLCLFLFLCTLSHFNCLMLSNHPLEVVSVPPSPASQYPLIGTHDGSFHCDEALAISMLTTLPEYSKSSVLRTRNPDHLAQCAVVVDVGAVYDPERHRYDHHQREFTGTFSESKRIKLSSAGLVYKHFGKRVIGQMLEELKGVESSPALVDVSHEKLYSSFIEHIDAIDNGVEVADGELKYQVSTTLSARVGRLNPAWNEDASTEKTNAQFVKAVELTGSEFREHLKELALSCWPARSIVEQAFHRRQQVDESGRIVVLDQYCPWQSHLFDIEKECNAEGSVFYVLYGDSSGSWRIQAVPEKPGSFYSRKSLPADWMGLRDDILSAKTGIPDGIFVHATGFIGGHKTAAGALSMAKRALIL